MRTRALGWERFIASGSAVYVSPSVRPSVGNRSWGSHLRSHLRVAFATQHGYIPGLVSSMRSRGI